MRTPIQIRMGGYGPPSTTHSRALKIIGDKLIAQFGDAVDVKYLWNVMDFGYHADDALWMRGKATLAPSGGDRSVRGPWLCDITSQTRTPATPGAPMPQRT